MTMARALHVAAKAVVYDPPIRRNGRCVVCNKARPEVAIRHLDPFCASSCARAHYNVDR